MQEPRVGGGSCLFMGMPHAGQPQLLHEGPLQQGRLLSFLGSQSGPAGPGCQRGIKMPQAALLSSPVSSIRMSTWGSPSTSQARAWGRPPPPQTPPLRQQSAGTWTNTCTNGHCPGFWWDHPGCPSPAPPPTLAVLNTNALCHLVILGKKDCSWRQQPHALGRAGFAPGLQGSPGVIPWGTMRMVSAGTERALLTRAASKREAPPFGV